MMGKTTKASGKVTANKRVTRSLSKKKTKGVDLEDPELAADMALLWFDDIREKSNDFEHKVAELGNIRTIDVNMNTDSFQRKQQMLLNDFSDFCYQSNFYKDKMEPVSFVMKGGKTIKAPELFVACACDEGELDTDKVNLATQVLVDYAKQMKMKKKGQVGENYQPNFQAVMLRTLLSLMKERYNWNYTMKTFHFTGGLPMVMSRLFQARMKTDKTKKVCF